MSWREVLQRAAAVHPDAGHALPALLAALDAARQGRADPAQLRGVMGLPAVDPEPDPDEEPQPHRTPPFVAALDSAARASAPKWDSATLAAVRAALRELVPVLSRLRSVIYGAPLPPPSG